MKPTYIIQGLDTDGCWSRQYISRCRRGSYSSLVKAEQARRDEVEVGGWLPENVRIAVQHSEERS